MGWLVPELVVEEVLSTGLDEIAERARGEHGEELVRTMFANVSDAKRASIRAWLTRVRPRVMLNYPREPGEVPCYAIALDPEQDTLFVGETLGWTSRDDAQIVDRGDQWSSTIGVIAYSANPQELIWLYQMAKFTLVRHKQRLIDAFEVNVSLSGREFGFEQRFLPQFIYRRVLEVHAQYVQRGAEHHVIEEIDDTITEGMYV